MRIESRGRPLLQARQSSPVSGHGPSSDRLRLAARRSSLPASSPRRREHTLRLGRGACVPMYRQRQLCAVSHSDRCGVVGIGPVLAIPLLVPSSLRFARAASGQELRVHVHLVNVGRRRLNCPPPQPHSPEGLVITIVAELFAGQHDGLPAVAKAASHQPEPRIQQTQIEPARLTWNATRRTA